MVCINAYPPDLARYVEAEWPRTTPLLLSSGLFLEALSACFQASFTQEEGRPTRFRLLLADASELPESGAPNQGVLRLTFDRSRPLTSDELRRLSPAAAFETALIGAQVEDGALRIWGLAHSGPAWLAPTWGGRSLVPNWTYAPIVHVTGPGQIGVRSGGRLLGGLERGLLVTATMDVFESEWLPALFVSEREEVQRAHAAHQATAESPTLVEHSLVGRVAQQMLRRVIQLIRGARHGGMLLVLNARSADPSRALRLKYALGQDEPSHRYRTLLFQILEAVAGATSKSSVGWADFVSGESPRLEKLEHAVFEWSRVIANLAAIDGAVVLDKQFGLRGFGAEVSAELPSPPRVLNKLSVKLPLSYPPAQAAQPPPTPAHP